MLVCVRESSGVTGGGGGVVDGARWCVAEEAVGKRPWCAAGEGVKVGFEGGYEG